MDNSQLSFPGSSFDYALPDFVLYSGYVPMFHGAAVQAALFDVNI